MSKYFKAVAYPETNRRLRLPFSFAAQEMSQVGASMRDAFEKTYPTESKQYPAFTIRHREVQPK